MLIKNKKGNFLSWFFVIIVLLAFSLFILILSNSWKAIKDPLAERLSAATPSDNTDVNITKVLGQVDTTNKNFGNMIPFLLIGLFAFVLITAGAIIKHPIMIVVGIIVLGVLILIAVVFTNVYDQISTSAGFSETSSELGIQKKFMDYLPTIVVLLAIGVFAAILYGKSQGGGGQL